MESKYLLGRQSGVECQRYKNRGTIAGALYRRSAVARALAAILLCVSTLLARLFEQDAALLRHFDYDQKAPLDVQEAGVEQRGDVTIHDISYASPKGGRVPSYLVVPQGQGTFCCCDLGTLVSGWVAISEPQGVSRRSGGAGGFRRSFAADRLPHRTTGGCAGSRSAWPCH